MLSGAISISLSFEFDDEYQVCQICQFLEHHDAPVNPAIVSRMYAENSRIITVKILSHGVW
jgi:hypothetical protein